MSPFKPPGKGRVRFMLFGVVLVSISILRAGSALHYSTWNTDEHFVIPIALGFLDYDFNPRWYGYHTLPMYIIAGMYAVLYSFYGLAGLVGSKVEFAALLFENDAIFYVSARLLVSCVHTVGLFILALIVQRNYRSTFGAMLVFTSAILMPDSVLASNGVRVETFIFLFLCLLIFFSCYSTKNHRNLIFSLIACAAAIASKVPALMLFPVLIYSVINDIRLGHHSNAHLVGAIVGVPLLVLALMPYTVLDFETYRQFLEQLFSQASGAYKGKIYDVSYQGTLSKIWNIFRLIADQGGMVSVAGTALAGLYALMQRNQRILLVLLFILSYTASFTTSAFVAFYWLRPVYPLFIFLTVVLTIEISRHERCLALFRKLEQFKLGGLLSRFGTHALLLLLAIYFAFLVQPAAAAYYKHLTDTREDTRILAARWITEHLPEDSSIILDTYLPHYLPRIFSQDPYTTLYGFDYPLARRNQLLVNGFNYYFSKHQGTEKRIRVTYLDAWARDFDPQEVNSLLGNYSYIVLSSHTYERYYSESALQNDPILTGRAHAYYNAIKKFEPIAAFTGHGPRIDIYRIP